MNGQTAVVLLLVWVGSWCGAQVTLQEGFDPAASAGSYTIVNGSPFAIHAFAVDNPTTNETFATFGTFGQWESAIVTQGAWDEGFVLTFDQFTFSVELSTTELGSFASLFGPEATQANVYWAARYFNEVIVPGQTATGFFFSPAVFASTILPITLIIDSFDPDGGPVGGRAVGFDPAIPEPTASSFWIGLGSLFAVLGLWRRRRSS